MCEKQPGGCPINEAAWSDSSWLPRFLNHTPGQNTWIIIHEENKSLHSEMVSETGRISVVLFGGFLSAWTLAVNLFLCWLLTRRRPTSPMAGPSFPARWLVINSGLCQLLLGAFVIPLNVVTEKTGHWCFGPIACRIWLSSQVLLVALTVWSLLVIALDRFVYVVQPLAYARRMGRKSTIAAITFSWLVSLSTLIPLILALDKPDVLLEEMCAVSMTRQHAITLSFAVFLAPATLTILAIIAVTIAAVQAKLQQRFLRKQALHGPATDEEEEDVYSHISEAECCAYANCRCKCCPSVSFVTYSEYTHVGGVAASIILVTVITIALWAPFYVTNVLIPFCNGMCVNPNVWSLFIWLGYSNAGISPVMWLLDPDVRSQLKAMLSRQKTRQLSISKLPAPVSL